MKKIFCVIMIMILAVSLFGCSEPDGNYTQNKQGKTAADVIEERATGGKQKQEKSQTDSSAVSAALDTAPVDVDLTKMTSTMVYAEVNHMVTAPDDYKNKRVRMKGTFEYSQGDDQIYFACLIADATACCAQGIEFVLKEERKFPDEYPDPGTEITVSGIFNTYLEGENQYCQLKDAVME